ncbi:MAG: hypothetical protein O2822_04270 [Chloroflexi bacterium]|nr:hypothetical protein [Chloroflexota bacterium]
MSNEERPVRASDRATSGFERVERAGAEAMAQRPDLRDEDGRAITDPGQDARAPEERPTVRQALLDEAEQHIGSDREGTSE